MFLENYNPLEGEMIQIMDSEGTIVRPEWLPEISHEKLLTMYKTMKLSRSIDERTLKYQRQGRMLTYAPNLGQEATQVGTAAALRQTDWVAPSFRELGVWLYKGAPLENIFLYWFGNEMGMKMPKDVKILPVTIPIASQFQHATGLAFAARYKGEDDIALAYVGDGGTSQGDFHEALNFASVNNLPNVFVIQNNQYAISTKRFVQTKSKNLALKALAYGMPGILVDGNDILAMYAVTSEAVARARNGEGPTLIEAYTYRMGAHTTSDDPSIYRSDEEVEAWRKKDPIDRLKKYLIKQALWSEDQDILLDKEQDDYVKATFESVENSGMTPLEDIFDYVYEKRTPNLETQYLSRRAFYEKEDK